MVFAIPQWRVDFNVPDDRSTFVSWIVSGEANLDALVATLRWNGINTYGVFAYDPASDVDPRRPPAVTR